MSSRNFLVFRPRLGYAVMLVCVLLSGHLSPAHADDDSSGSKHKTSFQIAVASNFRATSEQLIKRFKTHHPLNAPPEINASYASSGKLTTQILHGAPFSIFLSADQASITRLQEKGLTKPTRRRIYAIGQLTLWQPLASESPQPGQLFSCLAIANPKLAPYGKAAEQVIQKYQRALHSAQRLIMGQSVAQVYQYIHSGNCEAGYVAKAQLLASGIPSTQWSEIPPSDHAPVMQEAALLNRGKENPAAMSFWAFLKSPEAIDIIRSAGYLTDKAELFTSKEEAPSNP